MDSELLQRDLRREILFARRYIYEMAEATPLDSQTSPHIEGIEDKKFFRLKVVN